MTDTVTFAERCSWAPGGPEDMTRCPNDATGGVRFILRPAEAAGESHGIEQMLSFITDLPVCATCFPHATPIKCLGEQIRRSLGRMAQKQNKGIPVDWSRTLSEHVPFNQPEYIALRRMLAANDSAGPPKEAA